MRFVAVLAAIFLGTASPASAKPGSLLIIGGGMKDADGTILKTLRVRMPNPAGRIAIIPSASGEASLAVRDLTEKLVKAGFDPANILPVRLAAVDDPASAEVNEASWAGNAINPAEIARIEQADAIWFTGGDQLRTLRLLTNADESDTPILSVIRQRLAAGAVVAGTSAGAAIMGSGMIVCGSPDIAATGTVSRRAADCDVPEDTPVPLVLGRGLGFLKGAVVDQHFSQRDRWVRLLRATACMGRDIAQGFGIDEDTALLVDLRNRRAQIIGSGGVAHVEATKSGTCDPFAFDVQTLSYKRSGGYFRVKGEAR